LFGFAASAALIGSIVGFVPATAVAAGNTRLIHSSGTASIGAATPISAAGTQYPEISGQLASGPDAGPNRSHSQRGGAPVGAVSQPNSVTNSAPDLVSGFDGLNHFDQRFGADNGNQLSLEPPDQGLCVGTTGGRTVVLEVVNDVLQVYDSGGTALTPVNALNPFLGYPSQIVRSTLTFGPDVTDPSCLFDAATGRWFLDVVTLDVVPQPLDGQIHFTGPNHIDLAVSNTSDPAGAWTIYRIPVQDDGTQGTPDHHCSAATSPDPLATNPHACIGDYPHLGSDANGIYITTNEYSLFGNEFRGAQIYAFSKAQLASLAPSVNVTQFDTHAMDSFGFARNGFTLWPTVTPGGGGDPSANGTEYFLSSNAAAEARPGRRLE
jgi:hypothetical protein